MSEKSHSILGTDKPGAGFEPALQQHRPEQMILADVSHMKTGVII
ncbi:hypothetical protein [Nostoc sp. 106C]|nr:hypothetical protein [Nostoc sp. 106C]